MSHYPREKTKIFVCKIVLFMGIFFFFPYQHLLIAEEPSTESKINEEFLVNFKDDFAGVIVSPKDWDRGDIYNLSAILGTGIFLYTVDQDIQTWFQDHRTSSSDDIFDVIAFVGKGGFLVGLITTFYVSGEISHNRGLRKTALLSLESWLTSGAIVSGLKFVTGRARPKTGESSCSFHPFSTRSSFLSFPSGDASSAFAVATTIADQSKNKYVDILSYSIATLVAVGRIHNNKHWASDVFIGSALGYFVAKKISLLNRYRDSSKLKVGFQFSPQKKALSLTISF